MKRFVSFLALALTVLLASSALATTITTNAVVGFWQNSVPPPSAELTIVNGNPTSTISWGDPAPPTYSQSGYVFKSNVPPPVSVNVPPTSPWVDFGDFTHNNFPIYEPLLQSVQLRLDVAMDVGGNLVNRSFIFGFSHNETSNLPPCNPAGSPACPDVVTVSPPLAGQFEVDGVLYTLELGFKTSPEADPINQFITQEEQANYADLYGRFTSEIPVSVPEPTTLLLLGSGLLGLVALRRRVKK